MKILVVDDELDICEILQYNLETEGYEVVTTNSAEEAFELPLQEFEKFLASAGYAFMPSSKFDLIVKYCVMNQIYNLVEVDIILDSHGLNCFAPE